MILQSSHTHDHPQHQQPQTTYSNQMFSSMLDLTKQFMQPVVLEEIGGLKRYCEEKVYLSYSDDPSQYLLHMLHKKEDDTKDDVAELIFQRERKVAKAIKKKKYKVKENNDNSIKKIREELSDKLSQMKEGMENLSQIKMLSKSKGNGQEDELYKGYMQFRKKGYWKEKSENSEKVKSFLGKMRKYRKQLDKDHAKHEKMQEEHQKIKEERLKKLKEQQSSKMQKEKIQKLSKAKTQKLKQKEQEEEKKKQVEKLLKNYRIQKRLYQINEDRYKKEILQPIQAERKKKLAEIRKQKQPLNFEQLEIHQQKYQEFKQKLLQNEDKREQDQQIYEKNLQKLKELYHSHFHEKVEEEINNYQNQLDERKRYRERIQSYSGSVKYEYKPRVDPKKKKEIEKTIKMLEEEELQRGKRKIVNKDGSIIYKDSSPQQKRKIGLGYLEKFKKENEGKKRKDPQERSASMMQLSQKPKRIDYLKEMRQQARQDSPKARTNKGGWRKIIGSENFSNRDKYNSVMDHVQLLEHEAKQKELQLKYVKGGEKAIDLKEQLDKFYLESVAAKMQVLKDVMLR